MPVTNTSLKKSASATKKQAKQEYPPIDILNLVERIVRVEEELKHLRLMSEKRFSANDKRFDELINNTNKHFEALQKNTDIRFEAIDKRFEDLQKNTNIRFEEINKRISLNTTLILGVNGFLAFLITMFKFFL